MTVAWNRSVKLLGKSRYDPRTLAVHSSPVEMLLVVEMFVFCINLCYSVNSSSIQSQLDQYL